jgi:flagellar basal-body rod protein FlgC
MSSFNIFDLASMGMSAQSIRLNTIASNLANGETVSSTPEGAYRSQHPIFSSFNMAMGDAMEGYNGVGVKVDKITQSNADLQAKYDPTNPQADANGMVYLSNVNMVQEMADMISASRTYQTNVQMLNAAKDLMHQTINLGK